MDHNATLPSDATTAFAECATYTENSSTQTRCNNNAKDAIWQLLDKKIKEVLSMGYIIIIANDLGSHLGGQLPVIVAMVPILQLQQWHQKSA